MKRTLSILMVIGLLLGGIPAPTLALPSESGILNLANADSILNNKPSLQEGNEIIEKDNNQLIKEQPIVQESSPLPPLPGELLVQPQVIDSVGSDDTLLERTEQQSLGVFTESMDKDSYLYLNSSDYQNAKKQVEDINKKREELNKQRKLKWNKEVYADSKSKGKGLDDKGLDNIEISKPDPQSKDIDAIYNEEILGKQPEQLQKNEINTQEKSKETSAENQNGYEKDALDVQAIDENNNTSQDDKAVRKEEPVNTEVTPEDNKTDINPVDEQEKENNADTSEQQADQEQQTNQVQKTNQNIANELKNLAETANNQTPTNNPDENEEQRKGNQDLDQPEQNEKDEALPTIADQKEPSQTEAKTMNNGSWYDYNNLIGPTAMNNLNMSQYSLQNGYEETISPLTGDLLIKTTDRSLPGRNGFDLEIGRLYESNQSLTGDRYTDGQGSSMNDQSTYDLYRNALGTGWSFTFPSVEVRGNTNNQYLYYHNGKGATYKVNFTPDATDSNLDNYDLKDVKFEHMPGTVNLNGVNMEYEYTFIRSDQSKEYFAKEGRLLGLQDRFGNQISFKYEFFNGDISKHVVDTNRAPNYSFEYQNGSWGIGNQFYYDNVWQMEGSYSLAFSANSGNNIGTTETYSTLIPTEPNTMYHLHGYLRKEMQNGKSGLGYYEWVEDDGELKCYPREVSWINSNTINSWSGLWTPIYTSPNNRYIQIAFCQDGNGVAISGKSAIDAVKLSKGVPAISEITDSIGRKINFKYKNMAVWDYDWNLPQSIEIKVQDPTLTKDYTLTYTRGSYNYTHTTIFGDGTSWSEIRKTPYLSQASNGNIKNYYTYDAGSAKFSYQHWTSNQGQNASTEQLKLRQNEIQDVATQAYITKNMYEYGQTVKHLGDSGYYELGRIISRSERPYGTVYTDYLKSYSYLGDYNGTIFYDETGYSPTNQQPDRSKDPNYKFTMTMTQTNGLGVSQTSCGGIEYSVKKTSSAGESETTTNEQYDGTFRKLPTKVKLEQTSSQGSATLYKGNTYNSWGGLASETKLLTNEQWNDSTTKSQNTISYTYDPTYKCLTSKNYYQNPSRQLTESTSYDSQGRMVSTTNAKGETTSYEYSDSAHPGNLTRVVINLPDGRTSITEYAYSGNVYMFPTSITQKYTQNGVQNTSTTTQTYDYLWGNVVNKTDPLGKATAYEYDNQGRVTKVTYPQSTGKDGSYTLEDRYIYSYPTLNNGVSAFKIENDKYKNGTLVCATASFYDSHGNLIESAVWDFERNAWTETENLFNSYGQLATTSDANNNVTIYSFDAWDRLNYVQDGQGNKQQYQYDIFNRTRSSYFLPNGETRQNDYSETYDQWGRVISRKGWPGGTANTPITEQYEYDLVGNCTKVIDPGNNQTNFQYDPLNRVTKITNALGEQSDYGYDRLGGLSTVQQYDGSTTFTTAKGYDERGLNISKQEPLGSSYTNQYNQRGQLSQANDPKGRIVANQYYDDGRLGQTTAAGSSMTRYYTPLGGTERYNVTGDGESLDYDFYSTGLVKNKKVADFTNNYTYDLAGNLTQMTDPFSLITSYQYDSLNRPQAITVGNKTFTYEYYGDGMIKAVNYPDTSIRTDYTYDNINRLIWLTNSKGSEIVYSFSYEYDNNGNITSVNENGSTTQYGYDALNRLSTVTRPDGGELHYTYDSRGNRTSVEADISNVIPGTLAYNDWEELESFTTNNNTYTYTYDAQGLRTRKTGPNGTTRYHCDNAGRVIAESDASNQVTAEIIWGHKPLARKVGSSYYYYLYNGHGDVIALTDETGQIVNSYSYDEWGNTLNKQETISNPIRYGGEYYDEESGLYYLRARYYDPTIGRFISKDSNEGDINNPLTINLYTYCWNNPIIRWDPTGNEGINVGLPLQSGYSYFETHVSEYLNPSPPIEIQDSYTSADIGMKVNIERPVITDEERQAYKEQAKLDRQIEYQKQVEVREMMQSSAWKTIAVVEGAHLAPVVLKAAPRFYAAAEAVVTFYGYQVADRASKVGPTTYSFFNKTLKWVNSPDHLTKPTKFEAAGKAVGMIIDTTKQHSQNWRGVRQSSQATY